jgi:hypothetical protein
MPSLDMSFTILGEYDISSGTERSLAGRGEASASTAGAATAIVGSPTRPGHRSASRSLPLASRVSHRIIGVEVDLLDAA